MLNEYESKISDLFDRLVPRMGKAETVAGEIVRAACRLNWRWWNDGDVFFVEYGIETCGSSWLYLCDIVAQVGDRFTGSKLLSALDAMYNLSWTDDTYEAAMQDMIKAVVEFLAASPELEAKANTIDSRSDYQGEAEEKFGSQYEEY